jgi:diaminopimelate decarboxylase
MNEEADYECTVAGRCCESGALIQENVKLPWPKRGDIIAVLTTGAYNYAMSSNYNRLCRPAIVMLTDKGPQVVVKRETFEDLCRNDV